jgi:tetratricopeptide (TPR) repeat protein
MTREPHAMNTAPSDRPQTPAGPQDPAAACYERAAACQSAGNPAAAEALYLKARELSPGEVGYHFSLGAFYQEQGRREEALACFRQCIALDDGCGAAHYNIGLLLLETRRFKDAAAAFQRAIEANPKTPAAHNNLGISLQELGRSAEALTCFQLAGRMDPGYAQAHGNAGRVLFRQERWDEAIFFFRRAVAARPDHAAAWHNLGLCFHKKQNLTQARCCYEKALSLDPAFPSVYLDTGNICLDLGDLEGMADWYRKALDLASSDAAACTNVGRMFQDQGRLEAAMECFDAALARDPSHADAHFQRATILLARGRWQEGWKEYEWRFKRADWRNAYPHRLPAPRWEGGRFAGKTLLVHCEQGFGDAIQFVRYLPLVKARGGTVLLEAPAPLLPLFRGLDGIDELLELSDVSMTTRGFDLQAPLLSLPGIFKTTPETIPAQIPYLSADPLKAAHWNLRLAAGQIRVGIVWSASGWTQALAGKSCRLSDLIPLVALSGIRLYGLQKGAASKESAQVPSHAAFENLGEEFEDFSDTAAVLANLDLILSVDTAVAHLAGAMGKPVWVLLQSRADWRWMAQREYSPWYPTMRLFRQQVQGDWAGVFGRVQHELALVAESAGGPDKCPVR